MTTAEIKDYFEHGIWPYSHLREDGTELVERKDAEAIIETLLARQAEVLVMLKRKHTLSRDDNVNVALWNALDAARAILNPENET